MKNSLQNLARRLGLAFVLLMAVFIFSASALADPAPLQQAENSASSAGPASSSQPSAADTCKDTTTSDSLKKCVQDNKITKDLQLIVNVLSAGVGIVVIAMIIMGGIQYSIAGDNSQATTAAKQRITNALIALVAYLFIFAFLQWLIPGGLFG